MKKIYTLIAVTAMSFGATAQFEYDLSAEFNSYTAGADISDDPMDGTIVLTNVGATIPAGDTLFFNFLIDGDDYNLDLTAGYVNYFVLEEDMLTDDQLAFGNPELAWAALGMSVELCANVYGVGSATFLGDEPYIGDTDVTNNTSCITYNLPVDDSGIEDLNVSLSEVYVASNQLMIVNDGANDDVQADLNIVNMNGQIVQTENFVLASGTSIVELNNLPTGIYIVAIETEEGVITRKISVQ